MTNFNLTDPKTGITKNLLDDYGGIIINTNETYYERECMPQLNFITDKNSTRDGELFLKSTYGIRTIEITCLFTEEQGGGDLVELKRWLGKKYQQLFQWDGIDDNSGIFVIENGGWQSKAYYQKKFVGEIQLKFIAHDPYYFIKDENDIVFRNLEVGDSKNIRCAGNCDSYPLIKITPNGSQPTIQFQWNDLVVTLNNIYNVPVYLDCKIAKSYHIVAGVTTIVNNKYSSNNYRDYPIIDSNVDIVNNFKILTGSILEFRITPRSKII
jgi:phage-related protein